MQQNFSDFLRHGGNGEYMMARRQGRVVGHRVGLSRKSTFPNYSALRADFSERLDEVVSENTGMLLNALTPPDTVPMVTEADLRDMSDAVSYTLDAWDVRQEAIFAEYQTHPPRLRPLRHAMEERLVRGFAGLVNQLRQEDLGIEAYIWRSQDDRRVRDNHAGYDDRVFRWDSPPDGGHPGQAHNCRCWAEPLPVQSDADIILADAPAADVPFESDIGLRPITPSGLTAAGLLAAAGGATLIQRLLDQPYLDRAERVLGADTDTVEGFVGTWAYGVIRRRITDGLPFDPLDYPKNADDAEILAQAAGLFAMMYPDVAIRALSGRSNPDDLARLDAFLRRSHDAYLAGRIQLNGGDFADGWVETFPELTEDERRLGEVPGFTPARIEQWLETYPIDELGLPNSTGSPIPGDPTGNIISTPIPEEAEPNIVEARPGNTTTPNGNTILPHGAKGDGEEYITGKGHTVEQIDDIIANPRPDLSGFVAGRGSLKGQDVRLLTGSDGHWVKIDADGNVRATSNRNLPLGHNENYPGDIIRPLE